MMHRSFLALSRRPRESAFTLIELLIVVAIIAILAAIAIPNFIESQVRAKVARAKSDMRTIAGALEIYRTDNNHYPPNDGVYNVLPAELSTPLAYISSTNLVDPFSTGLVHPVHGTLARFYTYHKVVSPQEFADILLRKDPREPLREMIDSPTHNPDARKKYGFWKLVSNGPDRSFVDPEFVVGSAPLDPNNVLRGQDMIYDSTNGTASKGNILRTQSRGDKSF